MPPAAVRPAVEADFGRGIVSDEPRSAIPQGGVYDASDLLFNKPGVAYKRGGFTNKKSDASYTPPCGMAERGSSLTIPRLKSASTTGRTAAGGTYQMSLLLSRGRPG